MTLTARWRIGTPVYLQYLTDGQPLRHVEASCYRCGRRLGNGGWPVDHFGGARVETLMLEPAYWHSGIRGRWELLERAKEEHKER
jgi:hypothetical protein